MLKHIKISLLKSCSKYQKEGVILKLITEFLEGFVKKTKSNYKRCCAKILFFCFPCNSEINFGKILKLETQ